MASNLGTLEQNMPVGAIAEATGAVTIIRADGTSEAATIGTPVYLGDVVETAGDGAANIVFTDDSSMAISQNAHMSIDHYDFAAASESGVTDLSVDQGIFVFTSGLIGRDDPDNVTIDTPVGSIGIRGTTIAGQINPEGESKITVTEGAIVVRNATGEVTLTNQFETVRLSSFNNGIEHLGVLDSQTIGNDYNVLRTVAPQFFTNVDGLGDGGGTVENTNGPSPGTAPTDSGPGDTGPTESTQPQAEATDSGTQEGVPVGEPAGEDILLQDDLVQEDGGELTFGEDVILKDTNILAEPLLKETGGLRPIHDPSLQTDPTLPPSLTDPTILQAATSATQSPPRLP